MRRALLPFFLLTLIALPHSAAAQTGGPIGAPVTFTPKPDTTLTLEGRGPFRGALEIRREGGALTIVNALDLDHYVMGVREVPGNWPMEALKAQAVAARTYALWEIDKGYWKRFGFDVCATVSCQVYQGATAELGERGKRWVAAVKATAGQILFEAGGKPALTRYHSTSGGSTLNNETVYPSDGARPYLKAIDDPFDEVSPLHTWKQSFKREHLQAILKAAVQLNGTITDITVDQSERKMTIKTEGGKLDMTTVRFRREMSETAPTVYPDLYPGTRSDGEPMPFTMPSSRFEVEKTEGGFVFHGRGYGHGVGMSQYGAMGRAKEGHTYGQILAAYYGGLRPQPWTGQKMLRVAVVRGVSSAMVSGNGAFGVTTNGQTLAASTLGGWATTASGERSVQVRPPTGYDLPLALTGVNAPPELLVDPPAQGRTLDVGFVVPKPAQVTGVLLRGSEEVMRRKIVVEAGERELSFVFDPDELPSGGDYRVELAAFDGTTTLEASANVKIIRPPMSLWTKLLWLVFVAGAIALIARRRAVGRRRKRGQSSTTSLRGQMSPSSPG
jgi:SpoIID/LytB domain protein